MYKKNMPKNKTFSFSLCRIFFSSPLFFLRSIEKAKQRMIRLKRLIVRRLAYRKTMEEENKKKILKGEERKFSAH